MAQPGKRDERYVPTYCFSCNAGGPDLLKVHVVDGVAVGIGPNDDLAGMTPHEGKVCVKAMGMINKHYNPNRIKGPMKRTNPKKGVDEDPGFVEISWDEALDIWAKKMLEVRKEGLVDENGYPTVAWAEGSDGACPSFYGTMSVVFGALGLATGNPPGIWGPVDISVSQGGGVKCYHTEHLCGEMWHKGFTCLQDTPHGHYSLVFGRSDAASFGVSGVYVQAQVREKGNFKRVQVEPHLSTTGAVADEWIPIKPETDNAFLYAMIHVILDEMEWRKVCDIEFLKTMSNSPYLVAPNGYFLRDPETQKPLVWDTTDDTAKPFDSDEVKDVALEGEFAAGGITIGPDGKVGSFEKVQAKPSFQLLREHVRDFTPEWAERICEVPAATIRRVTNDFVTEAMVGATIKIDGVALPYRPVNVGLGKTQNNGWGGLQGVWAAHVLQTLVGAMEVPGGHLGSTTLFSGPLAKTNDGFMEYPFGPSEKERWSLPSRESAATSTSPLRRDGTASLAPFTGHFLGPSHLAWKFLTDPPENWPAPSMPKVYITFKINPVISQFETPNVLEVLKRMPFHVAFAYTMDETVWFADLVLPEDGDLESLQIWPVGGSTFFERWAPYSGLAIKQPVVKRFGNTMNITDIATELADRMGMLAAYNEALNHGAFLGMALKGTPNELVPGKKYTAEEIYDRLCRAGTRAFSQGAVEHGLDWFKENGGFFGPYPKMGYGIANGWQYSRPWYLYPYMKENGCRFELPYQERLLRIGQELRARLKEHNITWWEKQTEEFQALPKWLDTAAILDEVTRKVYGKDAKDYPLWALNTRSMQYAWGSNAGVPLMDEAASEVLGHKGVQINTKTAEKLGIKVGDQIWVESPYARTRGRAVLREGIRPDVVLLTQMYGHFKTPFAKDLGIPNLNQLMPALIELTDESGGSKDHAKVRIYKA